MGSEGSRVVAVASGIVGTLFVVLALDPESGQFVVARALRAAVVLLSMSVLALLLLVRAPRYRVESVAAAFVCLAGHVLVFGGLGVGGLGAAVVQTFAFFAAAVGHRPPEEPDEDAE